MTTDDQPLQEMIAFYQALQNNAEQLQKYTLDTQAHYKVLEQLQSHLKTLETTKEETELFVPINAGVFIKAKIQRTEKVLLQVGAGVCVEKTPEEAQETMEKQKEQVLEVITQLEGEMAKVQAQMHQILTQAQKTNAPATTSAEQY